jgi:hypothetical protein
MQMIFLKASVRRIHCVWRSDGTVCERLICKGSSGEYWIKRPGVVLMARKDWRALAQGFYIICGSGRRVRGSGYSCRRLPEPSVRILDGVSWASVKRVAVIPMYYFAVREKPYRLNSQSRLTTLLKCSNLLPQSIVFIPQRIVFPDKGLWSRILAP